MGKPRKATGKQTRKRLRITKENEAREARKTKEKKEDKSHHGTTKSQGKPMETTKKIRKRMKPTGTTGKLTQRNQIWGSQGKQPKKATGNQEH